MAGSLKELSKFIHVGARLDLKAVAVEHILGLTATEEGVLCILEIPEVLVSLITLFGDKCTSVTKDSCRCIVNISAFEKGAVALINLDVNKHCPPLQHPPDNIVKQTLNHIFDKESKLADPCCMILSNLTRWSQLTDKVIDLIIDSGKTFDEIINIFTKKEYNKNAKLHYLGPVLSNLTQSSRVRKYILDKNINVIQRLLPFTEYRDSIIRRGGIIGTLKNCCFDEDYHEWLLSEDVDILPRLLLPLAGSEEFDEDENDKLPLDLQYLPEDKTREEDPDIRCMLLEALAQLCTKRPNREYTRKKNAYVILRELHKREKDKRVLFACENLVDILIRTEEEIGHDNLKALEVPDKVIEDFNNMEKELLNT